MNRKSRLYFKINYIFNFSFTLFIRINQSHMNPIFTPCPCAAGVENVNGGSGGGEHQQEPGGLGHGW